MATHQEIAQVSDQDLLDRMIKTHDGRFNEDFWQFMSAEVGSLIPEKPLIVDVGCGPGLLLRDLQSRHLDATLFGYDITEVMIDYAKNEVQFLSEKPRFITLDITISGLPHGELEVDLLLMAAVLHVLPEPLPVLANIRKCLKPDGVFLLHDWVARPLPEYLDRMLEDVPEDKVEMAKGQMFKLFPSHNKYTIEDWSWLLSEAGFNIVGQAQLGSPHFRTFVCQKS
ncbi:MAG: SAM-dependent methyltransferase [Candidatus Azotimanducaceae bacterium]|jgi:SAM-dependent methyltransferase